MKPSMNYTLEQELEMAGHWTNPDIRLGGEKCDCDCDHNNPCKFCVKKCDSKGVIKARPSSLYERLTDCNKALGYFRDCIKNFDKPYPSIEKFCKKFTLQEHKVGYSILKFQVQAMRKILFPNEHRLIWNDCPICQKKSWFYRLPNYTSNDLEVRLTQLSGLFHCSKCHFVAWESELDQKKLPKKAKYGIGAYIQSKSGLRSYLQSMATFQSVCGIMMYYHRHERDKESLDVDHFMIKTNHHKGGMGYQCIACRYIYKRKNMAEKHLKNFWKYTNDGWKFGCMLGIKNRQLQLMDISK